MKEKEREGGEKSRVRETSKKLKETWLDQKGKEK